MSGIGVVADFDCTGYCVSENRSVYRIARALNTHQSITIFSNHQFPFGNTYPLNAIRDFNLDIVIWGNFTYYKSEGINAKHYVFHPGVLSNPPCDVISSAHWYVGKYQEKNIRAIYTDIPFEKSYFRESSDFILLSGCVHPRRRLDVALMSCINYPLKVVYNPYKEHYIDSLSDNNLDSMRVKEFYAYYSKILSLLDDIEEINELEPLEFEKIMSRAYAYLYAGCAVNGLVVTEALCYGVPVIMPIGLYEYCHVPLQYSLSDIPFHMIFDISHCYQNIEKYIDKYLSLSTELSERLTYKNVGSRLLNQL